MADLNTWYYSTENSCVVANGQTRSEYKARLAYKFIEPSIENNTSKVLSRLQVRSIDSDYGTYGYNQTTTIQGHALSAQSFDMRDTNTWQNFGEKELTFTHDADGTKTKTLTASFTTTATSGYSLKSGSVSVTVEFPPIPRASAPTLSASSVAMGSSVTINTNRVSDSFTHTITYKFGSASGTIASSVGTSTTWTPSLDLANQIPNATSGTGTITCQTYNGSTLIGSKSISITLTVPSSVIPSISSIALSAGNSVVPSSWGVYVQGKSTLKIVTTASGSYSSTIKSYKITGIDNNTYYSSSFTSSTLQISGTRTITVTVTDSRGRTATKTTTYTCVAYSNPSISTATVTRCNSDGTANEEGEYVKYSFKASVASVSSKNTYAYKLGYKLSTDSSYTYITISNSSYTLDKSNVVISGVTFSVDNSYDFQFLVNDYFTSTSVVKNVGTGFTLMDFNASGKGVAIGKVSEKDALEVGLPTEIDECTRLQQSGSTTDNRKLSIDGGNYNFNVNSQGGWANGLKFRTNDGATVLGCIGAFGDANKINYYFIGNSYDDTAIRVYPEGTILANTFSGTATRANKLRSYHSGSDSSSSAGWYKIGSATLPQYYDLSLTLLVTQEYGDSGSAGLLRLKCRNNDGTSIYVQKLKWLTRYGWAETDAMAVVSGSTVTLYIYTSVTQHGRIGVTVLENSNRGGDGAFTRTASTSPTTGLTATRMSSDADGQRTSLYDNSSGSNGTITLSITSDYFYCLEIYYKDNNSEDNGCVKVFAPNGKSVSLTCIEANSTPRTMLRTVRYGISGTTMTVEKSAYATINNSASPTVTSNNYVYVTKVIGYR